jgi:hypothetical protein
MNKKISADDFHDAIERQLSGLEPDPWLAQRIIASDKEEVKVKKISHATVIIVAIIVLAMATALAAGLGGRVNWLGEVLETTVVSATPIPTAEPQTTTDPDEIDPAFYELLDYSKDRELIMLSTAHKGIFSSRIQQISNMNDFITLMDTAAPDFPLPAEIPEGYVLDKCSVEFGCLPQGEYTLTSQTVHPEGFTESHYAVDPSMDFVKGYSIILKTEDEKDYISILVYMNSSTNPKEYTFGITEDQSARVVQVAGMENALIIDSENTSLLAMRKVMSSPQDDLQFTGPEMEPMIETYNEYRIEVRTPLLPENELVRVFVK